MSDIEKYESNKHNAVMMAIKSIADGQYERAIGHLTDAIRAESARSILFLQELSKTAEESESNV